MTEDEIATRAGIPVSTVRELVRSGILEETQGSFAPNQVMRARAVEHLMRKGIDREAIAAAVASGDLLLGHLESAGRRPPRADETVADVAHRFGIEVTSLQRILVAFGLPRPQPDERIRQEDLQALRMLPVLLGAGIGEEDLARLARVWGGAVRKAAWYQVQFLHRTAEEPFRRRGLGDNAAFEATIREVGLPTRRAADELISWLFRRHGEDAFAEHQYLHVEAALEAAGVRERTGQAHESVAFADLTGYTALTETMGDAEAAGMSVRLADLADELAEAHRGHVVKMLGDGVLLHFADPVDAVSASLALADATPRAGLPPAHVGVNAGPMIPEEGDYFGRTVNLAARIASVAGAHEVLVGADVVRAVPPETCAFADAGAFELKGIAGPVPLFRAMPNGGER